MNDDVRNMLADIKEKEKNFDTIKKNFLKEVEENLKKMYFYMYRDFVDLYKDNRLSNNYDDLKMSYLLYIPRNLPEFDKRAYPDNMDMAKALSRGDKTYYFCDYKKDSHYNPIEYFALIDLIEKDGFNHECDITEDLNLIITISISYKKFERIINNAYEEKIRRK